MQINNEHLKFLEECREAFETEPLLETYRNKEETLIGLRRGPDRDGIDIYELGENIAFFAQQIEPILLDKKIINQEEDENE